MKKHFIEKLLFENIESMEVSLNIESIADTIQSSIEKLSKSKIEDISAILRQLKKSENSQMQDIATEIEESLVTKIDEAIASLTEIKNSVDDFAIKVGKGSSSLEDSDFGMDMEDIDAKDLDDDIDEEDIKKDDEDEKKPSKTTNTEIKHVKNEK